MSSFFQSSSKMPLSTVHLPDGQTLTVTPVFGGLFFKSHDLSSNSSVFPAGWTINIHTDTDDEQGEHHENRYKRPTLRNDGLFISSISNPSNSDFRPPTSPTRQIAMMLWATLYWYFQQEEPEPYLTTEASKNTPQAGKPRGDWRITIKREGVFRGRNLVQKLERMGLISTEDSAVGTCLDDSEGWSEMFVSRRSYWQLPATLFLFTLTPTSGALVPGTPSDTRSQSSSREGSRNHSPHTSVHEIQSPRASGLWNHQNGPFASGSHLPTYYPPPPVQYTISNHVRHPIRPKPPRQGETFYTRYIPSIGQYLSFRTASLSPQPVPFNGPVSQTPDVSVTGSSVKNSSTAEANSSVDTMAMSDLQLLNKWMNDERVAAFWGCKGPISVQEEFLKSNLNSKHSFPVIGCWDGKPFGYMELYWAKEDNITKYMGGGVGDYDRGIHVLVGEQELRGAHRLRAWLSALVHWEFGSDYRTESVLMEPRIDNERFITHLQNIGFSKEMEINFPHKHSAVVRYRRENFEAPAI